MVNGNGLLKVDIVSGAGGNATSTKQDTMITSLSSINTSITSLSSKVSTCNTNSVILAEGTNNIGNVNIMGNNGIANKQLMVNGNGLLKVDIVSGAGGNATSTKQDDMISSLSSINTSITSLSSKVSTCNTNSVILAEGTNNIGKVNVMGDNGSGSKQLLVNGNGLLKVDIVSGAVGGNANSTKQDTMITSLSSINTSITSLNSKVSTCNTNSVILAEGTNNIGNVNIMGNNGSGSKQLLVNGNGLLKVDIVSGAVGGNANSSNQNTMITSLSNIQTYTQSISNIVINDGTSYSNGTSKGVMLLAKDNSGNLKPVQLNSSNELKVTSTSGGGGGSSSLTTTSNMFINGNVFSSSSNTSSAINISSSREIEIFGSTSGTTNQSIEIYVGHNSSQTFYKRNDIFITIHSDGSFAQEFSSSAKFIKIKYINDDTSVASVTGYYSYKS
jgi:hypothetical protein